MFLSRVKTTYVGSPKSLHGTPELCLLRDSPHYKPKFSLEQHARTIKIHQTHSKLDIVLMQQKTLSDIVNCVRWPASCRLPTPICVKALELVLSLGVILYIKGVSGELFAEVSLGEADEPLDAGSLLS